MHIDQLHFLFICGELFKDILLKSLLILQLHNIDGLA